ncbi:MAG: hypothetical protein NZ524_04230, partial [Thiobacillaceae bacterium]|nr:hypothetical protein [Thiobacillaceae bacterium]
TSAPLRIVTLLGVFTLLFGAAVAAEALIGWLRGVAVSGFTTTIITLLVIGSVIMISLGVIGEYIAKIYDELKARPIYLVQEQTPGPVASAAKPAGIPGVRTPVEDEPASQT